jgi:multisubunit Na+/H+ antiporter MnhB subunit
MVVSEIAVWAIALGANAAVMLAAPQYYETTLLTSLLHRVLTHPYPYWGIVILSGLGTFLSIKFGDELMDVIHHRDRAYFHTHHFKHELILFAFFLVVLAAYYQLIASIGIGDLVH